MQPWDLVAYAIVAAIIVGIIAVPLSFALTARARNRYYREHFANRRSLDDDQEAGA